MKRFNFKRFIAYALTIAVVLSAMTLINRVLNRVPEAIEDISVDGVRGCADNADTSAWYYLHIQEATSSYTYTIKDNGYEVWTSIVDGIDWADYQ